MPSLIEVYLEIGKIQTNAEKVLICKVPEKFGNEDPSETNILKRLQEFSFSAPNPVVKDSDNRRFAAVQYTYVLQECVSVKSATCDITTVNHYVFCLQREDGMTTHCISSLYPFFRSFYKLLSIISTASKDGKEAGIEKLLSTLVRETRVPTPGNSVTIHLPPYCGIPTVSIEFESPFCLPLMYENDHIAEFYRAFGLLQSFDQSLRKEASTLTRIFAHLLMERRFLVTSNEVRRFTSCSYALQTILYPLEWNYTFVPLLFPDPRIIDMVGLPQPYIMGIHKSFLEEALKISDSPEDCVIVLDVDTGQISPHYADDLDILPKEVRTLLETRLSNSEMISRKGDYFCRIFMDALVLLIGDYSQFFIPNGTTGVVEFSWRKYQNYRPENDYKRFALAAESKLGMIKQFILSRLELVRLGRQIAFDDFERSLKDRPLIVKECRGNMQHRIKHGAGKLMGTARDGFKKLGGTFLPPRSQSRPILEHGSNALQVEVLRRPLSQEDVSYSNQRAASSFDISSSTSGVETSVAPKQTDEASASNENHSATVSVASAASQPDLPDASEIEKSLEKPTPAKVENDLICLTDDSSDEEDHRNNRLSLPIDLALTPVALFDPLEQPKQHAQPKSRSGSVNVSSSGQTRDLIDRVLTLYSIPMTANQPPAASYPVHPMTFPITNRQPSIDYAYNSNNMFANAQNIHSQYRQSTLFPGRIPLSFQASGNNITMPATLQELTVQRQQSLQQQQQQQATSFFNTPLPGFPRSSIINSVSPATTTTLTTTTPASLSQTQQVDERLKTWTTFD